MTPREKAEELVHKYVKLTDNWVYGIKNWEHKKQCALIAVDEILKVASFYNDSQAEVIYFKEVKSEIEKL